MEQSGNQTSYLESIRMSIRGACRSVGRILSTRTAKVAIFLWVLTFVCCYLRFTLFGLYEDDINQARFWAYTPGEMLDYVISLFSSGGGGRPLGLAFLRGGFMAGFNIGGLDGLYMAGMLVFVTNAFLTYKVTERIAPPAIALAAGIMFVLFPADALKITIVRGFAVQPTLTFALAGILCYVHRRYILAYLCSVLALITYEFGFLPFLLAPFFVLEDFRSKVIRVASHAVVSGVVLATVVWVRVNTKAKGHLSEITDLTWADRFDRVFTALWVGPWTSLKAYWIMPGVFFDEFEPWHLIIVVFVAVSCYLGLRIMWRLPDRSAAADTQAPAEARLPRRSIVDQLFCEKNVVLLFLVGVAAWIVAYAMAVSDHRFPPTTQFGRTTSVHTAATIGASWTFAAIVWAFALLTKKFRANLDYVVWPIVAGYLALLSGFQGVVQSQVILSWRNQKIIWTQIVNQVDDWRDGTTVIVGYKYPPNRRYVFTMSWATTVTAANIFHFPENWKSPPTTLFVPQLNASYGEVREGDLYVRRRPWARHTKVDPNKIIYFKVSGRHRLTRSYDEFSYKQFKTKLSPKGETTDFEKKPLYDVLIVSDLDDDKKK